MPAHAIVLGCHKIGLGIIRALGEKKVPVVAVYYHERDMGYVSKYVAARYKCPHPDHNEQGFISFLGNLAEMWKGGVLIPSDDATLIAVSKYRKLLSAHFKVAAAEWDIIEKCIDKKHTYVLAHTIGVPAPRTFLPRNFDEAVHYIDAVKFPCLLKPSVGHRFFEVFRKKMIFIEDRKQLREAYDKVGESVEMMLQEFIPGDDRSGVNYNSYFVEGKPVLEFTAQKMRLSPPRTGFPRVVVSKNIPEILEPGRTMLRALGFNGFSCMEFKKDARDGIYKLMEINPRQNLSTPLAVRAGINFPYLTYQHAVEREIPQAGAAFEEGVYWIDMGKDLVESVKSYRRELYSIAEYLRPYVSRNVFTLPSLRDPMPLFKRAADLFGIVRAKLVRQQ